MLDYSNPLKLLSIPSQLNIGAGPTNISKEVLHALATQPLTPASHLLRELMDDILPMIRYVYQTENPVSFILQTSGNGGNEAMVTNLADPGETVVIAVSGLWGSKVVDMAKRYNLNVVELRSEPGEVFTFEELEEAIVKNKAVALFVTHGETSSGTLQPLDGLGKICHKHNCLLSVDAVVSLGVAPIYVDRWEIDAINGGTQKGLSAPAGMCLLSFSPRAYKKILSKKHPPPYIFDVQMHVKVWDCLGAGGKGYIYTYSSNMLGAVREALIAICKEGIDNVWDRHQKSANILVSRCKNELGLEHYIKRPEIRFSGVTFLKVPENLSWRMIFSYILEKHQAEISFGIGPTINQVLRLGLLGINATPKMANYVVELLREAIEYCKNNPHIDDGFGSFNPPTE
ncbi:alanine--glyoxylate aminotransferase-like isoform X2 [Aethina tumida]|uniref:alanine--glyoxylate aminotransferase-like isoform X2 n=1 Tax=Aethina tumida TaxID=116153 RepID=UPI00214835AE|nr:alanine--glyoxylate aminotransferase-like isoform X2 [Aethina tumida]